jgi:DNA-binding CsgD family transcriptional regulator
VAWLEQAQERYRTANLSDAARILDEAMDGQAKIPDEAIILRSRLYLREKPSLAVAFLTDVLPRLHVETSQAEALLVLGAAYARVSDFRDAKSKFDLADRKLTGDSSPVEQVRAELAYQRAAALWMQRKIAEAERELAPALDARLRGSYIEALTLRGALYAAREKYESQAGVLLEALRSVTSVEPVNVYHWAHVTAQLSYLSRELPNQSIRNVAFEQVDRVPWTADLGAMEFNALKAVGWRRALEGDYINAFRYLKRASSRAPTAAWRVMASCDRAYLAASLGEPRWAEQERDDAANLAEQVEWRAINSEERIALLLLAELYAPHDGALAMSYVARFQETGDRFSAVLSSNGDRRVEAMVAYSLGFVHQHLDEPVDAEASYKESFEIYADLGYEWRAARAAVGLAQVARDSEGWLKTARAKLRHYPMSWLMTQLNALEGDVGVSFLPEQRKQSAETKGLEDLTPAQREVYDLLLKGISTREIAEQLERSEFTVRNHIKAVFKKLGVNSRVALMSSSLTAK